MIEELPEKESATTANAPVAKSVEYSPIAAAPTAVAEPTPPPPKTRWSLVAVFLVLGVAVGVAIYQKSARSGVTYSDLPPARSQYIDPSTHQILFQQELRRRERQERFTTHPARR